MNLNRLDRSLLALVASLDDPPEKKAPVKGKAFVLFYTLGFLFLSFPMSGIVRSLVGWTLPVCLVLSIGLCLLLSRVLFPLVCWRPKSRYFWLFALAVFAACGTFAFWALYNPYFDGFPGLTGGDSSLHLARYRAFTTTDPGIYSGMSSLYSITFWLDRFAAIGPFRGFAIASYAAPLSIAALLAMYTVSLSSRVNTASRFKTVRSAFLFFALLAILYFPALNILLPLLHFFQAEGFLPQQLVTVIHFLGILSYAVIERRSLRLLVLLLVIVFTRYTFLLNLPDLILTSGFVLIWESIQPDVSPRWKKILWGLAVGAFAVSVAAHLILFKVIFGDAGFKKIALYSTLAWNLSMSASILLTPIWCRFLGFKQDPLSKRLFLIVGLLGCTGTITPMAWHYGWEADGYYVHKYLLAPALIVCTGAALQILYLSANVGNQLFKKRKRYLQRSALILIPIAVTFFGYTEMAKHIEPYRKPFIERYQGSPPWRYLTALQDNNTVHHIRKKLEETKKPFGVMFSPIWPEYSFTNVLFGRTYREIGKRRHAPGGNECLFWYKLSSLRLNPRNVRHRNYEKIVGDLEKHEKEISCVTYPSAHDPGKKMQLCSACRNGATFEILPDLPLKPEERGNRRGPGSPTSTQRLRFRVGKIASGTSQCQLRFSVQPGVRIKSAWLNGTELPQRLLVWPIDKRVLNRGLEHDLKVVLVKKTRTQNPDLSRGYKWYETWRAYVDCF